MSSNGNGLVHLNQRRSLEALTQFAAAVGPVVQHLSQQGIDLTAMFFALTHVVRECVCPELTTVEFLARVSETQRCMVASVCAAEALHGVWQGVERTPAVVETAGGPH